MARYLPNPVNNLMADAMHGRISRRDIMKKGTALGLSSALMGTILRAESVGAQGTPAAAMPAGYSIEVPAGLPDLTGTTLNVMLGADGPGAAFDQANCDIFAEATGATVNYLKGAESATDRLTFYQQTFASSSNAFDFAMIDVIWPGILATHAVDLSEAVANSGVTYFDRIMQNNTVDDVLTGIPWFTDAGLLYYRTDLLEKYGFAAAPATWQELTDMATEIVAGEAASNSSFTGFTFQGAAYEGLVCNGLEWQFSNGGGTIIEDDGSVSVNNPNTIAAFERAKGWVGTISPQAVTGYMEEDGRGVWQAGNAAFMRNWPYAYSLGAAADSVIAGNFDVTSLPMGDMEGSSNAATLGGWQAFVSKYSESQEAATAFALFVASPEVQKARAIERSGLPTIADLYTDADVLAANPFFERLLDTFQSGSVARPSTASQDLYGEVATEYARTLNEILNGTASEVGAAVEDLAGSLEDIMADL
ncbi:MAG: ABC transporter substrate-binding protein [Thermomicrobiales bacterium]